MSRRLRLRVPLVVALLLAACSDDDDDGAEPSDPTEATGSTVADAGRPGTDVVTTDAGHRGQR